MRSNDFQRWKHLFAIVVTAAVVHCGYTVGIRRPPAAMTLASMEVLDDRAIDVDAKSLVESSVVHMLAARDCVVDARDRTLGNHFEVRILDVTMELNAASDPPHRAATYRSAVRLTGRLVDSGGTVLWQSHEIVGSAPYITSPGGLDSLEGSRRRALVRAASEAARQLVDAFVFGASP